MYHPESDSFFTVSGPDDYRQIFETIDGQLSADVTDDPERQAEYRRRKTGDR